MPRQHTPVDERFWPKVNKAEGDACWTWAATMDRKGYGLFGLRRGSTHAHRVSYELTVGPIPEGLYVLHKCDNRACVRPDHLFIGTAADNLRDAISKGRFYKNSDRCCPNGHEYPEGTRRCRICAKARNARKWKNWKAKLEREGRCRRY